MINQIMKELYDLQPTASAITIKKPKLKYLCLLQISAFITLTLKVHGRIEIVTVNYL